VVARKVQILQRLKVVVEVVGEEDVLLIVW
jgi:hypothetical protein